MLSKTITWRIDIVAPAMPIDPFKRKEIRIEIRAAFGHPPTDLYGYKQR